MSMKPKPESARSTAGKNPPRAIHKKRTKITPSSADRPSHAYLSVPGILNQMLDGLWVVNREDCSILNVNDAMCRMLGYSREELLQRIVPDIEAMLSPKEVRERIVQLVRDGSLRFKSRQRRKDGMVIDVDVSAVYLPEEDLIFAFHRDITEQLRAEKALRESEARYRLISNNTVDVIWVMDPMTNRFKYVSPSIEKLRGYTVEEAMTQSVSDALTPESLHQVTEAMQAGLQAFIAGGSGTESHVTQLDQPRRDGSIVSTEVTTTYVFNEQGDVEMVGVSRDITQRKIAEEALRKSEERFHLAMEATQDGLWDWDIVTGQVYYSPVYFEMLGYEDRQFPEHLNTWADLLHPEDRDSTLTINMDCIEGRCERFEVEFRMLAQDGTWRWILGKGKAVTRDPHGRALRLIGTHTDITERKQVEAALAKSNERLELAQESADIGVWDWNVVTGHIEWTSKMFELFGLDAEQDPASFATWRRALHPEDLETAEARIMQALNDHVTLVNEYRVVMPDGQVHWISAVGRGIYDQDGNALRMIGICTDITESKRAQEALRESEERFRILYETMSQGVIYYNADGVALSANSAAEHILGLSLEQLKGDMPLDPRWHTIHEDGSEFPTEEHPHRVALRTGQPVQNVVVGAYHPQAGNYVWVTVSAMPHFKPGDEKPYQVYVMFDDISARKRNSDIMNARLRLLEFASTHTVKELLQAALDEAGALVFSPIGFYHFVDSDQENLTLQAWSTKTRDEFCTASGEDSHYPLMVAGVWADGARERRAIIHNDYGSLPNKRGMPEGHAVVTRELVVPVMRGDQIVAIMGVGNKLEDYNATDLEIVAALADFSWDIIQQRKTNDELRSSEEQYRRLINLLPNGVVVHSAGKIELVNRAGNRFFGADRSEQLIGTYLLDRVDPAYRETVRERVRRSMEKGVEAEPIEEKLLRLDGSEFDAEVAAIPVNYAGKPSTMAVFSDITERKKRERELHAIAALSSALRTAPTRAEMLPVIVEQIGQLLDCDSATIEIIEPQTGDVIVEAAHGTWASLHGSRQAKGQGINDLMSQTLQPFHTDDLENDPSPFFNEWARKGIKGCLAVPLVAQEQLIGFIWIGRRTNIGGNEVELLSAVADIAANAIHRATLHELTQRDAAELTLAYDTTLEGWASTLAIRDQETEGHTRRVVEMTLELARLMRVGETELENIRRGALLHDIGKMGIPDDVLHKAGTLNEREWEIMRRHPEYAYHLLSRIQYLQPALDIPYCHHEKWDGSGYPRGLKGEDIPLPARIFAVVDVWDALTNDRPYRLAWSREHAMSYIRKQSGQHFDPEVVEKFMQLRSQDL